MKKIELHWQILIALVIGVAYGLFFPTKYKLTYDSFEKLKNEKIPTEVVIKLQGFQDLHEKSETEFIKSLDKALGADMSKNYKTKILSFSSYNPELMYVSWMGDLFMRALRMIIVPLILTSIISGVANIGNADNLGRLGLKTMGYYLITSTLAIVGGLLFVNFIKPGVGADIGLSQNIEGLSIARESFGKTLINIIPNNIFEAFVKGKMLSIIFFAILFGFFITQINEKQRKFLTNFFSSSFEVMMKLTMFVIKFTPLGILGIVAGVIAEQASDSVKLAGLAERMGIYMVTVLGALIFHAVVILPLMLKFIAKVNPWLHLKAMQSALLTAFSTSSSGATLSLTMNSVEDNSGVSNKISSFTLPLGATVNMDGTALYECIAAMFIAQAYGFELSIFDQVIVVVTALLASIGAAGIPMAGLVMISIILTAVGLPLEGIGLILAVDRILDMFRTSVNVWSDSCGAVIIAKSEGEKLKI